MALDVELISIESVMWPPGTPGQPKPAPCWKVTLGVPQLYGDYLLTAHYYFEKQYWTGDAVLPVAKSYLHNCLRDLAENTKDWNLDEDQKKALRRPQSTPPSANPA